VALLDYAIKGNFYLGKIEEFSFKDLQAFFRSSDHLPPHFHVKKSGRWEIKVYILTSSKDGLDYSFKFPKNKSVTLTSKFDSKIAKRIKSAWEWEAQDELIAIASASDDSLFVMGCDLTTWEVPFNSLGSLSKISAKERGNFELDEDGSYLYFPCGDIHLDLEDLKAAVDPQFKEQLLIAKLESGKSFGKAIATVRKAHQLNQNEIDGLSDRHLRRIENEGQQPTLDALKKLAASHQLNLEDYLTQINRAITTARAF
jgi:hypothetical protein